MGYTARNRKLTVKIAVLSGFQPKTTGREEDRRKAHQATQ
jgi:hypothetical protein